MHAFQSVYKFFIQEIPADCLMSLIDSCVPLMLQPQKSLILGKHVVTMERKRSFNRTKPPAEPGSV